MYFDSFPFLYFSYTRGDGKDVLVLLKDITRNVRIRREVISNITQYMYYDLKDGERFEDVAERVYGDPDLHWIIMILNDKYDYLSDLPLTAVDLQNMVTKKYGAGNEYAIHHYVNAAGFIVNSTDLTATSISNFGYEDSLNEAKRRIKLVSTDQMAILMDNFDSIMAT